jgi:DNA repair protein RadC
MSKRIKSNSEVKKGTNRSINPIANNSNTNSNTNNNNTKDSKKLVLGHRKRVFSKFKKINGSLLDYELMEMLLFYSIPRKDTKPIAKSLLDEFGSINASIGANEYQLLNIANIGESTVIFFKLLKEIYVKMLEKSLDMDKNNQGEYNSAISNANGCGCSNFYYYNKKELMEYCKLMIGSSNLEQFLILFFNNSGKFITGEVLNTGSITEVNIYGGSLIAKAVQNSCNNIIVVHNHPSGNVNPSQKDIKLTAMLKNILSNVEMTLLDHLIVSKNKVFSFRKSGSM